MSLDPHSQWTQCLLFQPPCQCHLQCRSFFLVGLFVNKVIFCRKLLWYESCLLSLFPPDVILENLSCMCLLCSPLMCMIAVLKGDDDWRLDGENNADNGNDNYNDGDNIDIGDDNDVMMMILRMMITLMIMLMMMMMMKVTKMTMMMLWKW